MSLVLPTFSPASPHSVIDVGRYIADASTGDEPQLLSVDSSLKPGTDKSSFVIRFDQHKNNAVTGVDDKIAIYMVTRGNLEAFSDAELTIGYDRVRAMLSAANLVRLRRRER